MAATNKENLDSVGISNAEHSTKKAHKHRSKKGKDRALPPAPGSEEEQNESRTNRNISENEEGEFWPWSYLADSAVSNHPAVFTKDSRYFFLPSSSSVKVYSSSTGRVVSTLSASSSSTTSPSTSTQFQAESGSHTDTITAILLNPQNPFQLLTASLDGYIKVWDFLDAVLLKTIDIGMPITRMCAHDSLKDVVFVVTSHPEKRSSKNSDTVYRISLKTRAQPSSLTTQKPVETISIGKARDPTGLSISPSGTYLVCTGSAKAYVALTGSLKAGFTKFVGSNVITCLAFHPSEDYFATGDEKGVIRLWYCLDNLGDSAVEKLGAAKRAPTTTLHWHAHAVSSIEFTPNGAYLLSTGEEAVLVVWQLQSGHREFVPRVGAPILSVSVATNVDDRGQEYLLTLADGSVVFIGSGSLKISRSFSRVKIDTSSLYGGVPTSSPPLALHPPTSNLFLPSSHPSTLQVFSPATSNLLYEIEVSPSNRVSRRDEKQIEPARITLVAVSSSGEWLATIDTRDGGEFGTDILLKIWKWLGGNSGFVLNTRIDKPHGESQVTSVSFCPTHDGLVVTTGQDGEIRLWEMRAIESKRSEEVFWSPRSSFSYRSQLPSLSRWSPDGSILVVSVGASVAICDPYTQPPSIRHVLTCPGVTQIVDAALVGKTGRYVAVTGLSTLLVWDLITCSLLWQIQTRSKDQHLITHPHSDEFLVWDQTTQVHKGTTKHRTRVAIFTPTSPRPIQERAVPFHLRQLSFQPSPSASSYTWSLVGITSKWDIMRIGDGGSADDSSSVGGIAKDLSNIGQRWSLFQGIFGASAFVEVESGARTVTPSFSTTERVVSLAESQRLFEGPSYLLPPMQTLFAPFMDEFLHKPEEPLQSDVLPAAEKMEEVEEVHDVEMSEAPRRERVIEQDEVNFFVEVFEEIFQDLPQSGLAPSAPKPTNGHINGASKAQGHTNGNGKALLPKPTANGPSSPTGHGRNGSIVEVVIPPLPSSPTVSAGQKRKQTSS